MSNKVYYSIVSSVRFSRNEENRKVITDCIKKGELNFLTRSDDYGECFEVDYEKDITEEVDENWLLEKVIEYVKKYKITEFELWKKHEEESIYNIGFGITIEGSTDKPIIKCKESYAGSLDDWNLSWIKGERTYEKTYVQRAL
ncbi:hypothetical protein FT637_24910 [Bacillus cereus]|uniref:DUF5514 family protein n=1 Tax=Bacillus cereus TaxID=1396 RepID=UPI00187A3094|nr:DUF5514 family protein [Bacillus cereus]MBE7106129.1 hypothetical protein [Bacillus cereus]